MESARWRSAPTGGSWPAAAAAAATAAAPARVPPSATSSCGTSPTRPAPPPWARPSPHSGRSAHWRSAPTGGSWPAAATAPTGLTARGTIQLWDVADPASPTALGWSSTDAKGFSSLTFSPRGHVLASGDLSGVVQVWSVADPARPAALARFRTNPDGFASVAFSPDGRILASGDDAGQIRLWSVADPARPAALGPQLSIAHSVSSVAFSPDGHTLAASSNGGYASAAFTSAGLFDSPGYIRLWDVSDPARPTRPMPVHHRRHGPGRVLLGSVQPRRARPGQRQRRQRLCRGRRQSPAVERLRPGPPNRTRQAPHLTPGEAGTTPTPAPPDSQRDALESAGCDEIFIDRAS
jgi:WD domain, G-beta repeat